MKPAKPLLIVTDHALVRYCERVLGLDMEAVRKIIFDLCAGPATINATCVRRDGFKYEMVAGRVVTVTPDNGGTPSRTARRLSQERLR
jgi:hypothetical protein